MWTETYFETIEPTFCKKRNRKGKGPPSSKAKTPGSKAKSSRARMAMWPKRAHVRIGLLTLTWAQFWSLLHHGRCGCRDCAYCSDEQPQKRPTKLCDAKHTAKPRNGRREFSESRRSGEQRAARL